QRVAGTAPAQGGVRRLRPPAVQSARHHGLGVRGEGMSQRAAAPGRSGRIGLRVAGAATVCVAACCAALLLRDAPLAQSVRTPIGLALVYTVVLAASAAVARHVPGPASDVPRTGSAVVVPMAVGLVAVVLARVAVGSGVPVAATAYGAALSV